MKYQDDRTEKEREELTVLIGGVDRFLSGWGGARGGLSVAAWACREEDAEKVFAWVDSRDDIKKTRQADDGDFQVPSNTAHFHVYAVRPGHPALGEAKEI